MLYYSVTAAVLIGLVSLLLVYTLKRLELPSYRVVVTTGIGSVAVSMLFPAIYKLVSSSITVAGGSIPIISALSIAAVVSLVLIFIISVTVSIIIPDSAFEMFISKFRSKSEDTAQMSSDEQGVLYEPMQGDGNYLKDIFDNAMIEKQKETANFGENGTKVENNLEKSVDSEENTDKMGIDTFEQDAVQLDSLLELGLEEEAVASVNDLDGIVFVTDTGSELQADDLTIEDCIDEAFRLKQSGDFEGAIINFMYALDRKPPKDLVFWIVLDVCVLYRELKQVELAKDILTAYMDNYGELMPAAVRIEIENNLQYN